MERRAFLLGSAKVLAAAATVSYFDIGASALVAEQRGQIFLTPQYITREALRMLENSLHFTGAINRKYDEEFRRGDHLHVRLPVRYRVEQRTGTEISLLQQTPMDPEQAKAFADAIDKRGLEVFDAERKALQERFGGIKFKREYEIEVDHG